MATCIQDIQNKDLFLLKLNVIKRWNFGKMIYDL